MLRKWRSGAGLIFSFGLILAMVGVATLATSVALADSYNSPATVTTTGANTLTWTGQGTTSGSLDTVQCDANTPYLLWIFTFDGATLGSAPVLHLGGSGSGDTTGTQPNENARVYQFTTGFFNLSTLTANVTFNATALGHNGSSEMVLTISHGCPGPPPPVAAAITTAVFDAATDKALIGGNLVAGRSVYDTATVNHTAAGTPTGTVTYDFFTNGTCTPGDGKGAPAGIVTLAAGAVPNSGLEGPLVVGSYSFQATFASSDLTKFTNATSACEPFTVTAPPSGPKDATITTVVFNAATNVALVGNLVAGGKVYDTSTVKPDGATGTVSYTFYTNGTCTGDGTAAGTALALGTKSSTEGPLAVGSYSFKATFNSSNTDLFKNATSDCEPFTVTAPPPPGPSSTSVSTIVFDAATDKALIDGKLPARGSVYDTSTVNHTGDGTPTGTVSYTFWSNLTCNGEGTAAGTNLALGTNSSTKGPLAADSYSFKAVYTSGDTNFTGSTSACEPFSVNPAQVTATPTPSPTGGVLAATASPTGGVLAATGDNTPGQGIGLFLVALGLFTMMGGAFAWRRRAA